MPLASRSPPAAVMSKGAAPRLGTPRSGGLLVAGTFAPNLRIACLRCKQAGTNQSLVHPIGGPLLEDAKNAPRGAALVSSRPPGISSFANVECREKHSAPEAECFLTAAHTLPPSTSGPPVASRFPNPVIFASAGV